jgi:hypothetical protein
MTSKSSAVQKGGTICAESSPPMSRLHLQLRGAVFWFRKAVPVDLVSVVGKREVLRRLGSNRRAAERQAGIENIEADAIFDEARRKLANVDKALTPVELTDAGMLSLAMSWFAEASKQDETLTRIDVDDTHEWLAALADHEDGTAAFHQTRKFLKARGLDIVPGTPSFRRLSGLIREAAIQRERNLLVRFSAKPGLVNPRFSGEHTPAPARAKSTITLDELLTRFRRDQRTVRSLKTTGRRAAQDRIFCQIIGANKPIDAIAREDARRLYDWVKSRPLAPVTKNFYLAAFGAVMEAASISSTVKYGHATKDLPSPARAGRERQISAAAMTFKASTILVD